MKILHINDKIEINGGVETYVHQLCEYSGSYRITAFWLGVYKNTNYQLKWYNESELQKVNFNLEQVFTYLNHIVERYNIDIIHIHSLSNPAIINHCFSLVPVVRSMHEPRIVCPGQGKFWRNSERICDKPFGLHCFYHAYKEGCCNRHPRRLIEAFQNVKFETSTGKDNYQAIFAMSQYMIEEAKKVGYTESELVYNPYFTPYVEENELIDQSNQDVKRLIFVGRLSRTKGVHYFIAAGIVLLKMGYELRFDIIGDGHDSDFFKNMIPIEYNNHFSFHGWKSYDEINSLVNFSYLMIFPSIYPEAFGISGIEAMMRGKPVIGFDVGGVSTWLKDGKTGFLVPVKDSSALVDRIIILLNDKSLYHQFSINSRKIALEEFIVEKHMTKLVETYKKVLNQ